MARSDGTSVLVMLPWLKSISVAEMLAPNPICSGLVPPFVLVGTEPAESVCDNCVVNRTSEALKPLVSALAILLPMTAIAVSLSVNALTDEFIAAVKLLIAQPPHFHEQLVIETIADSARIRLAAMHVSSIDIGQGAVKSETFVPI